MGTEFSKDLALIGIGYWGKNLARNFNALGALHTICDMREEALESYRATYPEVQFTTRYSEVLRNAQIRRVAIAAPALLHYDLTKQALLADKDVYVEKPLCLDTLEAEELIQIAEERGLILMVGHILQFHPCVTKLQELLGRGELGRLQYITSNRLNLGAIRTEENALWNFAPHDVSVILSLCGYRLPDQVRSVGSAFISRDVADVSMTTLRFPGEIRAHIYVSWLNPFKEQKLTVVGSAGLAVFDDTKPWNEKLALYRNHVHWLDGYTPQVNTNEAEYVEIEQKEPLKEECRHFLQCCAERVIPLTDGKEALRVLKVLEAAQMSIDEEGKSVNPKLLGSDAQGCEGYLVHPTAVIDYGTAIGDGCKIGAFSHVMPDTSLGACCSLDQNVQLSSGVHLGNNVKVESNVSLCSGVHCEDDVSIGSSVVFTHKVHGRTEQKTSIAIQNTQCRKGTTIGANATILCGVELGEYCFIVAGSVITNNVKPYALIMGNPAQQAGWISRNGEKLDLPVNNEGSESLEAACPSTGEVYRLERGQLQPMVLREEVPAGV